MSLVVLQRKIRHLLVGNAILIVFFFLLIVAFSTNVFKVTGTSLGNFAENHSAAVSDGPIDGPSRMPQTVA